MDGVLSQRTNVHGSIGLVGKTVGFPALPHGNRAAGEINCSINLAVCATQIQHQHIVDEYPHIVVAGELEGHGYIPIDSRIDQTSRRLAEVNAHRHSKIMVQVIAVFDIFVMGCDAFAAVKPAVSDAIENLFSGIEGQEIANAPFIPESAVFIAVVGTLRGRGVIEDKPVGIPVILRKVLPHIIIVIPHGIQLEEAFYICIGGFPVVSYGRIK